MAENSSVVQSLAELIDQMYLADFSDWCSLCADILKPVAFSFLMVLLFRITFMCYTFMVRRLNSDDAREQHHSSPERPGAPADSSIAQPPGHVAPPNYIQPPKVIRPRALIFPPADAERAKKSTEMNETQPKSHKQQQASGQQPLQSRQPQPESHQQPPLSKEAAQKPLLTLPSKLRHDNPDRSRAVSGFTNPRMGPAPSPSKRRKTLPVPVPYSPARPRFEEPEATLPPPNRRDSPYPRKVAPTRRAPVQKTSPLCRPQPRTVVRGSGGDMQTGASPQHGDAPARGEGISDQRRPSTSGTDSSKNQESPAKNQEPLANIQQLTPKKSEKKSPKQKKQ